MRPPRLQRFRVFRRQEVPLRPSKGIHIYLLPNLFTTGNMFFGFVSILMALKGHFLEAAQATIAASVFDALDGRVARMTKGTSQFGVEYDSLSDLVSFGVAPALILYQWALEPFGRLGWLACFLFMACGALRLARFNVQAHVIEKKYFQGLPIPIAAGVVATSILAFADQNLEPKKNWIVLVMTILLALTMVSTIRYRSFKELDFRRRSSFRTLIGVLSVFVFILLNYELHLFLALIGYVVIGGLYGIFSKRPTTTSIIVAKGTEISESPQSANGEKPLHKETPN